MFWSVQYPVELKDDADNKNVFNFNFEHKERGPLCYRIPVAVPLRHHHFAWWKQETYLFFPKNIKTKLFFFHRQRQTSCYGTELYFVLHAHIFDIVLLATKKCVGKWGSKLVKHWKSHNNCVFISLLMFCRVQRIRWFSRLSCCFCHWRIPENALLFSFSFIFFGHANEWRPESATRF